MPSALEGRSSSNFSPFTTKCKPALILEYKYAPWSFNCVTADI